MDKLISGHCLCGKNRFECLQPPIMSGNCHCRDCQRSNGSPFATLVIFKKLNVKVIRKHFKTFVDQGGSGKSVLRKFCVECGSSVVTEYEVTPELIAIMGGTLNHPHLFPPQWDIFVRSKQPWVKLAPQLKLFNDGFKRN